MENQQSTINQQLKPKETKKKRKEKY